ncbi:MAG: hypothetical protein LH481_05115 [Burkholderiales bacterium]|nr:hypothetical protein [Burkholderiales bacterium]
MKARYLVSALVVSTFALAAQAQGTGIAFVTDVKGDAVMDAGKATLMAEVKKGARISCIKDCSVGVMYLISGKEYVLKGPGDFLVGDSEVTAKIGPPPTMRDTNWKVSAKVVAQVAQTSSASIRMRSLGGAQKTESAPPLAERLIYPRDTSVATLQPAFRWASANPKGPFEFELKSAAGAKSVYKTKSNATSVALPRNIKLLPDAEYNWMVKTGGTEVGVTTFKTLPTHSLDLTQKRKPDDKAPFSDWLLYALTLKDVGADQDAGEIWTKLAKERPDLPELAALAK